MPCDYKDYHPKWHLISRLIRYKRAGNSCEQCGVHNGAVGYRLNHRWINWSYVSTENWPVNKAMCRGITGAKLIRIVLTVAHMDHDKHNNRFNNLKALCQRCHLKHDLVQHIENRRYGRHWKRHQGRLF